MILLASTSALMSLITSGTSAIDVQASAMDLTIATGAVAGAMLNTAITTATTTTILGSPGSGVLRTLKTMSLRNKGGSANTLTVRHTDGTTVVEITSLSLPAGWTLHYHENAGWWVTDTSGLPVVNNVVGSVTQLSVTDDVVVRLTSDITNNNGTANTIADVTGLSFAVLANKLYVFEFNIAYTAAATSTGSRWSINGPASPTYLNYTSSYSLTTTTETRNPLLQAYDVPAASNATSATTGNNWALIKGIIQPSADGTVIARFASEVLSSAIVAKVNSFVRYRQITP